MRTRTSLGLWIDSVTMTGGEGKIFEIDESKFGKRKYNRDNHIEREWVFGGVERDSENSFLTKPVREFRNEAG